MGWGSSTRRGGGRKVRAVPRKFVFLGFGREVQPGMSREFCRDVPEPWRCSKIGCTPKRVLRRVLRRVSAIGFTVGKASEKA